MKHIQDFSVNHSSAMKLLTIKGSIAFHQFIHKCFKGILTNYLNELSATLLNQILNSKLRLSLIDINVHPDPFVSSNEP